MSASGNICVVCAWRATCQKKFSISGKDMKCSDFVRDVSIKEEKETGDDTAEEKQEKKL
jgi:hypothetical protein